MAARGLDIDAVNMIFNYELPEQAEVYVHRIGRTGRGTQAGSAMSLVAPREEWRLHAIREDYPESEIREIERPEERGDHSALVPSMTTIEINGGRKNRLRPGDLLGAITAGGQIPGSAVGKIDVLDRRCFIAVAHEQAHAAVRRLNADPIKGMSFRARLIRD